MSNCNITCPQRQDQKRSDLDEQLKEYINEWRKQRAKEEDELKRLKEKQAKRKVSYTLMISLLPENKLSGINYPRLKSFIQSDKVKIA